MCSLIFVLCKLSLQFHMCYIADLMMELYCNLGFNVFHQVIVTALLVKLISETQLSSARNQRTRVIRQHTWVWNRATELL